MENFKIDDWMLGEECAALASEALVEARKYGSDPEEILWQRIDGHEWVIYTYKAIRLCAECNTDLGEEFLEECGTTSFNSFDEHASMLAFGEMISRARRALNDMLEDGE